MGLEPRRVPHVDLGSEFLAPSFWELESGSDPLSGRKRIGPPGPAFAVLPEFLHLVETELEEESRHESYWGKIDP